MGERRAFSVFAQFRIDGEVAVVTGGGAGIGRAACLALAEAGAHVCVTDVDAAAAARVAREIETSGGRAEWRGLDVGNTEAIPRVFQAIAAERGQIDVLVNNAGVALREAAVTLSLADWERIVRINQTAVFLCSREAGRVMIDRRSGRIVNVASIMGLVGGGFYPNLPYHATKGAVVNMTRALAAEWAPFGVRVNAIAPTFARTELTARLREDADRVRIIQERTPLGRFAEAEEMAGGILYLASPASSMVTGHVLAIDGGWTAI
jgi:NAD(P)-dependent dehydrogenase (short-subunit alcohol dehydrogenase family)